MDHLLNCIKTVNEILRGQLAQLSSASKRFVLIKKIKKTTKILHSIYFSYAFDILENGKQLTRDFLFNKTSAMQFYRLEPKNA